MLSFICTVFDGTFYKWDKERPTDLSDAIMCFHSDDENVDLLHSMGCYSLDVVKLINACYSKHYCDTVLFVLCKDEVEFDCIVNYVTGVTGKCIDTFIKVERYEDVLKYIQCLLDVKKASKGDCLFLTDDTDLYDAAELYGLKVITSSTNPDEYFAPCVVYAIDSIDLL